jgi:probable rRNA maturation factor
MNTDKQLLELSLQFALDAQFTDGPLHRKTLSRARVKRWLSLAIEEGAAQMTVRVVGEAEGRSLNQQFRGKDYATNVLTFDYAQTPVLMADLVLCAPVVAAEAAAQNKSLVTHYAHLVVHGALHAQGYDHEQNDADALEMEALEVLLMGALGFDNPY